MSICRRAGWPRPLEVHQARRSATVSVDGPSRLGVPSSSTSTGPAAPQPGESPAAATARNGMATRPPMNSRNVRAMAEATFVGFSMRV